MWLNNNNMIAIVSDLYLDSVYFRVFCFGVHDLDADFSSAVSVFRGFFVLAFILSMLKSMYILHSIL